MAEHNVTPAGDGHDVQLWEPRRVLRRMSAADAARSCGFLRCRPEKWFPGFATHWLPVIHALGVEARLQEIKPVLARPPVSDLAFVGTVWEEDMVVAMDAASATSLTEELIPGASTTAASVVMEYFFRRFLSSLVRAWSGPEAPTVAVKRDADASQVSVAASIRISFTLNTASFTMWLGLGAKTVETFDGLWRRQVQSLSKVGSGSSDLRLEIAQLGVPPQMLAEYLSKGTVIDLEVKASDGITVKVGHKPWMPARLLDVGGVFGCEMMPGAMTVPPLTEGATQLCVEIGSMAVDAARLAELGQGGAVLVTQIPISGSVDLVINQERVGRARLCIYEGRFAIEVE